MRTFLLIITFLTIFASAAMAAQLRRAPAVEPWMEVDRGQDDRPRHLPKDVPTYNFTSSSVNFDQRLAARPSPLIFLFMMVFFPLALWPLVLTLLKRPEQAELDREIIRLTTKKRRSSRSSEDNTRKKAS